MSSPDREAVELNLRLQSCAPIWDECTRLIGDSEPVLTWPDGPITHHRSTALQQGSHGLIIEEVSFISALQLSDHRDLVPWGYAVMHVAVEEGPDAHFARYSVVRSGLDTVFKTIIPDFLGMADDSMNTMTHDLEIGVRDEIAVGFAIPEIEDEARLLQLLRSY